MRRHLVIVLAVLMASAAGGCTNEGGAMEALRAEGFSRIELQGYAWWGCAKDDSTCTGFVAQGANGRLVRGTVGCGLPFDPLAKGCTVRIGGGGR